MPVTVKTTGGEKVWRVVGVGGGVAIVTHDSTAMLEANRAKDIPIPNSSARKILEVTFHLLLVDLARRGGG